MLFKHLVSSFVFLFFIQAVSFSSMLPCKITGKVILSSENSPYYLECDLLIEKGASLILTSGTKIFVKSGNTITVNGALNCFGTENEPVFIGNEKENQIWNGLFLDSAVLKWENVIFSGGFIRSVNSKIDFNFVRMQELSTLYYISFRIDGGEVKLRNSQLYGNGESEGITIWDVENVIIFNCEITNTTDTIELISCYGGEIIGNYLHDCFDDGIDFNGSHNILIEGNIIDRMKDTGMTIGNDGVGASLGNVIKNNYISNCLFGFDAADSSSVKLYNNTFSNNIISGKLFQKNGNKIGATADIRNNIFYNSEIIFLIDEYSSAVIEYNLSNTSILEGNSNIFADPIFMDEKSNSPMIDLSSPCRNSGDPDFGIDSDGSLTDIGAGFYNERESIIISEIDYAPYQKNSPSKWIELCNISPNRVNISSWVIRSEEENAEFIIPKNTFIERKSCLILASDSEMFKFVYDEVENIISDFNLDLDLDVNTITLSNPNDKLIDFVSYSTSPSSSWTVLSYENAKTLELLSVDINNNIPSSWSSESESGSPSLANGMENLSVQQNEVDLFIYPNPASSELSIESFGFRFGDIKIYNANGLLVQKSQSCCNFLKKISISKLPKGVYFTEIQTDTGIIYRKFIKY